MYWIKVGSSWINLEHVQRVSTHAGGGCTLTMMSTHVAQNDDEKALILKHLEKLRQDSRHLETEEERNARLDEYEAP